MRLHAARNALDEIVRLERLTEDIRQQAEQWATRDDAEVDPIAYAYEEGLRLCGNRLLGILNGEPEPAAEERT